ncbi:hypothetical protein DW1_1191 [Proteiniborus sp. DW1]|nr:hypothetical protein DW1_1191 [Proteiniborus sp. DW1]
MEKIVELYIEILVWLIFPNFKAYIAYFNSYMYNRRGNKQLYTRKEQEYEQKSNCHILNSKYFGFNCL